MSKFRYAAPLAVLAMLTPAAVPDAAMIKCDSSADVVTEGDTASYDGLAPAMVDPSGENATGQAQSDIAVVAGTAKQSAIKVNITGVMTWDVPGDYELRVFDADGAEIGNSTAFNPTDGNVESATVTVDVCEDVTFVIENYLGTPGGPITLDVTVDGKYPREKR